MTTGNSKRNRKFKETNERERIAVEIVCLSKATPVIRCHDENGRLVIPEEYDDEYRVIRDVDASSTLSNLLILQGIRAPSSLTELPQQFHLRADRVLNGIPLAGLQAASNGFQSLLRLAHPCGHSADRRVAF